MNPVDSILRAVTRKSDRLNILACPTHERTQSWWTNLNATFWLYRGQGIKNWDSRYAALPQNHILLDPSKGERQLPPEIRFDLVLSQSRFGQFQTLLPIAQRLGIPLVTLEHTAPLPQWGPNRLSILRQMKGDVDIFITKWSREQWGWGSEGVVIEHGIDADRFCPSDRPRDSVLLSVANEFASRDIFLGFNFWREAVSGLPVHLVGDNPGMSKPASSVEELISFYQSSSVFVNTSLISPVPTSLLESMACGCAPISTRTCAIPTIINHGENGLLADTPQEMKKLCQHLLLNRDLAEELGKNARRTILERFSLPRYLGEWESIFRKTAELTGKR